MRAISFFCGRGNLQTSSDPGDGPVTHGSQLTDALVGPWAILSVGKTGYPGNLGGYTMPGRGYFRGDEPTEFSPSSAYIYSNDLSNKGGVVGVGGVDIDGYHYPEGTYVVQFTDFSGSDFYLSGSQSFVFRGCRFRGPITAPGYFNTVSSNTGYVAVHYCDMGGADAKSASFSEIPVKITNGPGARVLRNRMSFITTGIQLNLGTGAEIVENFITDLTDFGNGTSHLNGATFNGGETCALVLRNNIVIAANDAEGRVVDQTDCISFFQDFGAFPGSGTNSDSTVGYQIINNYIGGTGYCFYAGLNAGKGADTVKNMVTIGNRVTTSSYSTGGYNGAIAAEPTWGSNGNTASDNLWADGASAGTKAWG